MTSEKPKSGSEPVEIGVFDDDLEAQLAKSALESAGIECMIAGDDWHGVRPAESMSRGVRLLVKAEDAEDAAKVLDGKPEETN